MNYKVGDWVEPVHADDDFYGRAGQIIRMENGRIYPYKVVFDEDDLTVCGLYNAEELVLAKGKLVRELIKSLGEGA